MPGLFEGFFTRHSKGVTLAVLVLVSFIVPAHLQPRRGHQAQGDRAVLRRLLPEGVHRLLPLVRRHGGLHPPAQRGAGGAGCRAGAAAGHGQGDAGDRGAAPSERHAAGSSSISPRPCRRSALPPKSLPGTRTTSSPRSRSTRARARECGRECPWWPTRATWKGWWERCCPWGPGASEVLPLYDPQCLVSARLDSTRDEGLVRGEGKDRGTVAPALREEDSQGRDPVRRPRGDLRPRRAVPEGDQHRAASARSRPSPTRRPSRSRWSPSSTSTGSNTCSS